MEPDFSPRYRSAAATLIVGAAIVRLVYLAYFCPLDLAPDEAYYWDWSRQLDWCYHSKGPLVALLIRASCSLFGDTMFAVRLPAVLCGSLLLGGLYVFTTQVHRSDKLAFFVVVLALALPVVAAGSMLMTIDAPFLCAWMWALVLGHRALFHESRWAWFAAGGCVALGLLAKHTMVLWVPSLALVLATTPALRTHLTKSGFWIMTCLGTLGGAPIIAWNVLHDWPTLTHTQSHMGFENDTSVAWLGPFRYLGAQFGVLLGFWFIAWASAIWRHRPTREANPELRYLWWMSVPTFVFFALFSWKNGGGEPNWPMAAYLSGMVLTAGWLRREWENRHSWMSRGSRAGAVATAALGILIGVLMHQPVLLRIASPASATEPTPLRRVDPTTRLRGWQHLACEVDQVRAQLRERGVEPVLAADRWSQVGELGFYCEGQPTVYCVGIPLNDRMSQYDLWRPNPVADSDAFRGRTFVIVGLDLHRLHPAFADCEEIRTITYIENDHPIRTWTVLIGHGFRGFDKVGGLPSRR